MNNTLMEEHKEVHKGFFDAEVRCEKLIPIYMCLAERPSQDLMDAVLEELAVCDLLDLPHDIEPSEVYELLYHKNKLGFLAEFATPKPMQFNSDGSSWVSGWGYYQKKWFYSNDIEALELAAVQWANEQFEECKAESMKEKQGG